ncbi:replication initiator 1-like [Uloborus diversus]|uniref:replication initiator 1-like n=1 Tax=Uloborus diversus TaxID=327109 RepID=UPI0024093F37|nr:replication initiator 1-like [Uloborus diversus]
MSELTRIDKESVRQIHESFNAPAHNALSVKKFLANHNIPILDHPPYSPDLAPCDFFLFPKVKSALKGTRFESVEAVKEKATEVMYGLTENDLQHCYEQWKIRMERCIDRGGEYIEGDNIKLRKPATLLLEEVRVRVCNPPTERGEGAGLHKNAPGTARKRGGWYGRRKPLGPAFPEKLGETKHLWSEISTPPAQTAASLRVRTGQPQSYAPQFPASMELDTDLMERSSNLAAGGGFPLQIINPCKPKGPIVFRLCSVCNYSTPKQSHLEKHMLVHSKERPYVCGVCNRQFTQQENLKRHFKLHTGERPFRCRTCGKGTNHELIEVAKEKGFLMMNFCSLCNYSTPYKSNLKNHMLVHSKEKPHICPICHRRFSLKGNLKKHMSTQCHKLLF